MQIIIEINHDGIITVFSRELTHCVIVERQMPNDPNGRTLTYSTESVPMDFDHFNDQRGLLDSVKSLMP